MKVHEKEEAPKMAAIVAMTAARSIVEGMDLTTIRLVRSSLFLVLCLLLQSGLVIPSI